MKHINVTQGSAEWLALRKDFFTASEAPMMMGDHKNISRNQLLDAKKGWTTIVDEYLQRLFDKGHAAEEAARPFAAEDVKGDLFPVTGSLEVDGLALLTSFDGLTMFDDICFEHKLFNKTLAENVLNNVLEPHYYWQLEQQLLVSGADKCYFVTSDGTRDNWQSMYYESIPERREALIKGWKQFAIDLKSHKPEAKASTGDLIPKEVQLPALKCSISGSLVSSNLSECIKQLKVIKDEHFDVKVENEQGLADRLAMINNVDSTRKRLKEKVAEIKGEFVSFADFESLAKEADSVLQKLHSNAKKMAEEYKSARNDAIMSQANADIIAAKNEAENKINANLPALSVNIANAMKGKRTIESLKDAAAGEVAQAKIEINECVELAMGNALCLSTQAQGYDFLFNDWQQIAFKAVDDFKALVKSRIADHKEREAKREEEQRARIRAEEEAKAKREAEAKLRAEEAAKRKAEQERQAAEQAAKREQEMREQQASATKAQAEVDKQSKQEVTANEAPEVESEPEAKPTQYLGHPNSKNPDTSKRKLSMMEISGIINFVSSITASEDSPFSEELQRRADDYIQQHSSEAA